MSEPTRGGVAGRPASGRVVPRIPKKRRSARGIVRALGLLLVHLAAAALLVSAGCRSGAGVGPGRVDQVILVTIDTLRADHLGCYGDAAAETPNLDALARESVLYEDATTSAPITLVSHSTILTGLSPPAHGVRTNGSFRLPAGVETLPERLRARGFATAAFVGAFVLHHEFGLDQGFDLYDDQLPRGGRARKFSYDERRAAETLSRAGDWVLSKKKVPFFLWTHLFDPHVPYDPPSPFAERFTGRPYDGEIAYTDSELGKFLARLGAAGILERALIVIAADHGEGLGEHGELTHGLYLYQSTLRVPLIVHPPGGGAPLRVREPVGLIDVAPSIVAAVGAVGGTPMEGRVLPRFPGAPASLDAGRVGAVPPGYYIENLLPHYSFGWAGERGMRAGPLKLIRSVRAELYDLASDPKEMTDLSHSRGAEAAELEGKARRASAASSAAAGESAENPDLSVEARERLLALGYVSAGRASAPDWESGLDPRDGLEVFEGVDRAKQLLSGENPEEGIRILERLDAAGPPSVAVLGLLGQARMERGDAAGALTVLLRARVLDPRDYEIRRRIAEVYYAQGHFEESLAEAREALRLNDRNAESRSILGAALSRLGRREEAIASFREAIAGRPGEPALWYNLGLALEGAGRGADAESAYEKAVELDPGSVPARLSLADLLIARGESEEAARQLESAIANDPDDAAAHEKLGIVLGQKGDLSRALAEFDRLVALDPGRAEGYYDRGLVLERLGRKDEAAAAFREFLSRWKGDPARARAAREHLDRLRS